MYTCNTTTGLLFSVLFHIEQRCEDCGTEVYGGGDIEIEADTSLRLTTTCTMVCTICITSNSNNLANQCVYMYHATCSMLDLRCWMLELCLTHTTTRLHEYTRYPCHVSRVTHTCHTLCPSVVCACTVHHDCVHIDWHTLYIREGELE